MSAARKSFLSLLGLIFIDQTYLTITVPLLTLIFFDNASRLFPADTLTTTRSLWFGICVALPNILNIFCAPLLSSLSDEFGRKKILAIEIFSACIFATLIAFAVYLGQLYLVFAAFIVKGTFTRSNPTALAIIGDSAPRDKKLLYMGYLQLSISLGAALGPVIGGLIATRYFFATFNFAFPFFLVAIMALSNTLLTLRFMPETLSITPKHKTFLNWQGFKSVIMNAAVIKLSFLLMLIQLSWSMYYQFIGPILKTTYHFDGHQLGLFIGFIAICLAIATSLGVKILHQYCRMKTIFSSAIGLILLGMLINTLTLLHILSWEGFLWIAALPIAAGDVISYNCITTLYSEVVRPEDQGKVMGISFIVVALAWALTGIVGGILMGITNTLPLLIAPLGIIGATFYLNSKKSVSFNTSLVSH